MAKKHFLLVFMFVLIFLAHISQATTQKIPVARPWNDRTWEVRQDGIFKEQISYIYLIRIYDRMNDSIVGLDINEVANSEINDTAVMEKIINSANNGKLYLTQKEKFDTCMRSCLSPSILDALSLATGGITFFIIQSIGWKTFCMEYNLKRGTAVDMELNLFYPTECIHIITGNDLEKNWKDAMNNAMDALEESEEIMLNAEDEARKAYEEAKFAGLCNEDYNYAGNRECKNVQNAFNIIDSGEANEARYGQINAVKKDILTLNAGLIENANTTFYPKIMKTIWKGNGAIATLQNLTKTAKEAKTSADNYYRALLENTEEIKLKAEEVYEEASNERLEKITEEKIFQSGEDISGRIGKISERFEELKKEKKEADWTYSDGKSKYAANTIQNYLANAINKMKKANSSYADIEKKSTILLEDAKDVVENKRATAEATINKVREQMKRQNYGDKLIDEKLEKAQNALRDAEKQNTLGGKYEKYAEAIYLANAVAPTKSADYENAYSKKIAEIEYLLNNARQDGVYVDDLKEELEFVKSNRPENEMSILDSIKNEIEERIKTKYYDLEDKRRELEEKLKAAGADDLLEEMRDAERGLINPDGSINWLAAVGKLNALNNKYEAIKNEFEADKEKVNAALANQLVVEPSLIMPPVKIDEATEITYIVSIRNPKNYGGEELAVKVPLTGNFNFYYSDITDGADDVLNVQTNGRDLVITLKSIDAFGKKTITFKKKTVLATTRSTETKASGIGYERARVQEKTVFQLNVDNAKIALENIEGTKIDNGDPTRSFAAGVHTITKDYVMENAYKEERTNAQVSTTDTKATVAYKITITPNINLDDVTVNADGGGSSPSSAVVDCGGYACIKQKTLDGYLVTLQNVEKGKTATVSVSYTIENATEYVQSEIEKYKQSNDKSIKEMANEAEQLLKAGNTQGALQKIQDIKKKDADMEKEKVNLLKKYYDLARKIKNEKDDIEKAISIAQEKNLSNHSEISKLKTRADMLAKVLSVKISENATLDDIKNAIDEMNAIDEKWLEKEVGIITKQAQKDFENYKKSLNGVEEAQYPLKKVEDDLNVLLATQKAEDMIYLLADLDAVDKLANKITEDKRKALDDLQLEFNKLKEAAQALLTKYEAEYKDAGSSGFADLFSIKPENVKTKISAVEGYIKNGDIEKANATIKNEILPAVNNMNSTLNMLAQSAGRKISEVEDVLENKKSEFSAEQVASFAKKLNDAKDEYTKKNYIKTLGKATALINEINGTKGNANTMWYILAASAVLIGVIAFYFMQKKKGSPPAIKTILKKTENE